MPKNKLVDSNKTQGPILIGSHQMLCNYTLARTRKMLTNERSALKSGVRMMRRKSAKDLNV